MKKRVSWQTREVHRQHRSVNTYLQVFRNLQKCHTAKRRKLKGKIKWQVATGIARYRIELKGAEDMLSRRWNASRSL